MKLISIEQSVSVSGGGRAEYEAMAAAGTLLGFVAGPFVGIVGATKLGSVAAGFALVPAGMALGPLVGLTFGGITYHAVKISSDIAGQTLSGVATAYFGAFKAISDTLRPAA